MDMKCKRYQKKKDREKGEEKVQEVQILAYAHAPN